MIITHYVSDMHDEINEKKKTGDNLLVKSISFLCKRWHTCDAASFLK